MINSNSLPEQVTIVEVGPRDGLQNEKGSLPAKTKIDLVNALSKTGLSRIEAGSFVSPKWVPQMASSDEVFLGIERQHQVTYSALTPNMKGFEAAVKVNAQEVAVFGAASEAFSQKNINCSIDESLSRFSPIFDSAKSLGIPVRAYVSCVLGCPYQGDVEASEVIRVCNTLIDMGAYEVSLGDTIGVGTPLKTQQLLQACLVDIPKEKIAVHFHDTYGQALANILSSLQLGISNVDSSVAGLGGCPYANGASGNVATEDVLYMLHQMGINTDVDLNKMIKIGNQISQTLGRKNGSKVGIALA
jgi:hydroxymethylglutaryl-CoA lyase